MNLRPDEFHPWTVRSKCAPLPLTDTDPDLVKAKFGWNQQIETKRSQVYAQLLCEGCDTLRECGLAALEHRWEGVYSAGEYIPNDSGNKAKRAAWGRIARKVSGARSGPRAYQDMPAKCVGCDVPVFNKKNPPADIPAGAKVYAGRGFCSTCHSARRRQQAEDAA